MEANGAESNWGMKTKIPMIPEWRGVVWAVVASPWALWAICEAYTHNSQLQLEASDLGHCAIFLEDFTGHDIRTRENHRGEGCGK